MINLQAVNNFLTGATHVVIAVVAFWIGYQLFLVWKRD